MLSDGFILAVLTSGAFAGVYSKLPKNVREWIQAHSLATEIILGLFTYWLHGGTLTALTASAWVGLFIHGGLHVANNPEKYQHLVAGKEIVVDTIGKWWNSLNDLGRDFMASRKSGKTLGIAAA